MKVTLEEFLDAKLKDGDGIVVELKVERFGRKTIVEGELRTSGKLSGDSTSYQRLTKVQALRAMEILEGAR